MEKKNHYGKLFWMLLVSFVVMYIIMYSTVERWEHVHPNLPRAYMAGMMTAPMAIIELALMGAMYGNRRLNAVIMGGAAVALVALWFALRNEAGVGDVQFLRSMIPHHSGALLMCNQASLTDPEVKDLCRQIIESQEREIAQMNGILKRLGQ